MPGPWEKYQQAAPSGPWEKYAQQQPQEAPQPGMLARGLGWVGQQMDRIPAGIRGYAEAIQTGDAYNAPNRAWQGIKDPASVQTSEQMMERSGLSTAPRTTLRQPPPDAQTQWEALGNVPPEVKRRMLGFEPGKMDTGTTSNAKEAARLFDFVAPTGLELIPGAKGAKAALQSERVMKPVAKLANLPSKAAGKMAQELSSVSEEALRMNATKEGRKALQAAAGKEYEIGQRLVQMLDNPKEYAPNKAMVDNALKGMGNIDMMPVIKALQDAKIKRPSGKLFPHEKAANDAIQADINALFGTNGRTALPAAEVVDIRQAMDEVIDHSGDQKQLAIVNNAKLKGRKVMRDLLENQAVATGNPEYIQGMKTLHKQLDARDRLSRFLGKNKEAREDRAESFISNMWGKNKKNRQTVMADIGEAFGKDFLEESKLANLAAQLGEEGKPGFYSRSTTGRSKLGGTLLFPFSSPWVASRVTLPLAKLPAASVQALQRLAGAKSAGEVAFYTDKLKKAGLDDGAIEQGIKAVKEPPPPPAAAAAAVQSPPPSHPPAAPAKKKLEFSPQQNVQRRHAALRYLTVKNGDAPTQGEIYKFLEDLGEKDVPAPPKKPKLEREFKGRRDDRHIEFLDHALRGGVNDLHTKPYAASEAPQSFTLQGATFKRMRSVNRLIRYRDDQGKIYEFEPNAWIHTDLAENEVPF